MHTVQNTVLHFINENTEKENEELKAAIGQLQQELSDVAVDASMDRHLKLLVIYEKEQLTKEISCLKKKVEAICRMTK